MAPPQLIGHHAKLPNTKPRVSSPLTYELTFEDKELDDQPHPQKLELKKTSILRSNPKSPPPNKFFTLNHPKSFTAFFLLDGLLFIQFVTYLSLHLNLDHLSILLRLISSNLVKPTIENRVGYQYQIVDHQIARFVERIPHHFLFLITIAFIKSITGTCLILTGTSPSSYSIKNLSIYGLMITLCSIPSSKIDSPSFNLSLIISSLIFFVLVLVTSILICLTLLRLTQLLLELDDDYHQQEQQERLRSLQNSKFVHPNQQHQSRRSSNLIRHPNLLQTRYQHLMNPF